MFSAPPMAPPVSNSNTFQKASLPMSRSKCTLEQQLQNHMAQVLPCYPRHSVPIRPHGYNITACFFLTKICCNNITKLWSRDLHAVMYARLKVQWNEMKWNNTFIYRSSKHISSKKIGHTSPWAVYQYTNSWYSPLYNWLGEVSSSDTGNFQPWRHFKNLRNPKMKGKTKHD